MHRQILYEKNNLGKYKVDIAKKKILSLNSKIKIKTFNSDSMEKFKSSDNIVFGAAHDSYSSDIKIGSETKSALLNDFE